MDEAVALLNLSNRMHWRKTAQNPPTEKDADQYGCVLSMSDLSDGYISSCTWKMVAVFPEKFPFWMPAPELRKEDLT